MLRKAISRDVGMMRSYGAGGLDSGDLLVDLRRCGVVCWRGLSLYAVVGLMELLLGEEEEDAMIAVI
jgi:hypothetical protein